MTVCSWPRMYSLEQQIVVDQRVEGFEQARPAALPIGHDRRAGGPALNLELPVAVAIRLLTVGGQKVREARPQVAGHVPHDHREAVRLRAG